MVTCLISILRAIAINIIFASQRPRAWLAGEVPALESGLHPVGDWELNEGSEGRCTGVKIMVVRTACADNILSGYAWRAMLQSLAERQGAVYYELSYTLIYELWHGKYHRIGWYNTGTHDRTSALNLSEDEIDELIDHELI